MSDGTTVKGPYVLMDGTIVDAGQRNAPIGVDTYYIVPNKCTECQGFHEEPQCAAVCPVDCCVPDGMYRETVDELLAKKEKLHL
jgi:ferredoxin